MYESSAHATFGLFMTTSELFNYEYGDFGSNLPRAAANRLFFVPSIDWQVYISAAGGRLVIAPP